MDGKNEKPKIDRQPWQATEVLTGVDQAVLLITDKETALSAALKELLNLQGMEVKSSGEAGLIFQLGNFKLNEFFLEKARRSGASFFLVLEAEQENEESKKAEKKTLEFLQEQKLSGRIIKLSGINGQEERTAQKILQTTLAPSAQKIITLEALGSWVKKDKPATVPGAGSSLSWKISILALATLLFLPVVFVAGNIFLGIISLKSAQKTAGEKQALLAENYFAAARKSLGYMFSPFRFIGIENAGADLDTWLGVGQDLGEVARHLIKLGNEGRLFAQGIVGEERQNVNARELLTKMAGETDLLEKEMAMVEAEVPQNRGFLKADFEKFSKLRQNTLLFKSFLEFAPWLMGFEEKRTYLLLFQNNFELRPGGGFIGTIGLLTFNEGRMELRIEDVYTADGQLKGHVEPPVPLKIYLNQPHWYLRDSNWEADFPTNAKRAAWFLEKEMEIMADGVIAVDLNFFKKMLALVGTVELPDYGEKITGDNFFLKTQVHTQENFFPGSTQKKDYLSSVANALLTKLTAPNPKTAASWLGAGEILRQALAEKNAVIFLDNSLAQNWISEQGWGGEIRNDQCPMGNCVSDYLMVVDANLGVNKVNYFIKREIKKEITISPGAINTRITINYENSSPAKTILGGVYKNYLRILTPANASLEKVKIDGREIDLPKNVSQEQVFGKLSTGVYFEVLPQTKKEIEASYKIPFNQPGSEFDYQLTLQKQAGTDKDSLMIASNFGLSYNGNLSVDRKFTAQLKK